MKFTYKYQAIDSQGRYVWLEKPFASKADLLMYLVQEKESVIAQKKGIEKRAEGGPTGILPVSIEVQKGIKPLYENDKEAGVLKRTIVANTYWWQDSHDDVHLGKGDEGEEGTAIFSESIKGRASKIFPMDQHKWDLDAKMGRTINLYESGISWRQLGVGRTGMTEALFADVEIMRSKNERRYNDYLNNEIDQHSVGMRYQDIQLAVDDSEEYPNEYKVWQKFIAKIGNRSYTESKGYFFAVGKAQLREYSAVIAGSNELTPTMGGSGSGEPAKASASGGASDTRLLEAIKSLQTQIHI